MEEILHHLGCKKSSKWWDITISTGAGFLPSTVRIFIPGWNFLSLSFVSCIRDDHLLKAGHLSTTHGPLVPRHFAPRQPSQCNHRLQFVGCAVLAQTAEWRQRVNNWCSFRPELCVLLDIYDLCRAMIYGYSRSCSGLYPNQIKETF